MSHRAADFQSAAFFVVYLMGHDAFARTFLLLRRIFDARRVRNPSGWKTVRCADSLEPLGRFGDML